jgi:hypothetical protein
VLPCVAQLQCFIAEGVPHDSVVFEDNAPLLELFEHKQMGIFAQLSEACMYPRPNDSGLVTKLNALHARCVCTGLRLCLARARARCALCVFGVGFLQWCVGIDGGRCMVVAWSLHGVCAWPQPQPLLLQGF